MTTPRVLVIRVPSLDPGCADVPLAAALSLLKQPDRLVICLQHVETALPEHARHLENRLSELCAAPVQVSVELLGASEMTHDGQKAEIVQSGGGAREDLKAVLGVLKFVQSGSSAQRPGGQDTHAIRDELVSRRYAIIRNSGDVPLLAVVAQVQSTWPAFESTYDELLKRGIEIAVVAIPSEHEQATVSTPAFFTQLGARVEGVEWLQNELDTPDSSRLLGVVFYDPWDGLRPSPARAVDVANAGVPIFYFPYANSLGVGAEAEQMTCNMPVHHVASAIFVVNEAQRNMFSNFCDVGSNDVHITGAPKMDRLTDLRSRPEEGKPATTFLWNPHFHVGDDGWSTILDFYEPLIDFFSDRPELILVIRPHFRIARDFPQLGGAYARCWERLESLAAPNIWLDREADYLSSFRRSDVLLSDYSSLVVEYIQTDKPILCLSDGRETPLNDDATFFYELETADTWEKVRRFVEECARGTAAHARQVRKVRLAHFPLQDGAASVRAADVVCSVIGADRSRVGSS